MKVAARSLTLVYCTWVDHDGVAQSGTFDAASLRSQSELAIDGLAAASAAMLNASATAVPMQMAEPEQAADGLPPPPEDPAPAS
jgi:hypothetical protein